MSVTVINEKIKVGAVFHKNRVEPRWFKWRDRKIEIIKTNFMWNTAEGAAMLLHFSVAGDCGYYELVFNQKNLEWTLEKTEDGNGGKEAI
jgi:hypothetical protein